MKSIEVSTSAPSGQNDGVTLFTQFYVPADPLRHCELKECLRRNIALDCVRHIFLLNEEEYSLQQLGLEFATTDQLQKVAQIITGRRLIFSDVLHCVEVNRPTTSHIAICNADVFFDATLGQVDLGGKRKQVLCLLRHEYNGPLSDPRNIRDARLQPNCIYPRFDMQDVWMWHTKHSIVNRAHIRAFEFEMGRPGCDNKLAYLFKVLGFTLINDPTKVMSYHFHTNATNHNSQTPVPSPWAFVCPVGIDPTLCAPSFGIRMANMNAQDLWWSDNQLLYEYIERRLAQKRAFVVPRVAGIENNVAVMFANDVRNMAAYPPDYLASLQRAMKSNAGVWLPDPRNVQKYAQEYVRAFANCEMYAGWESQGNVFSDIAKSQTELRTALGAERKMFWACALDIFHYIYSNPWTRALQGKRLLIISAFAETMAKQVAQGNLSKIYDGVELFPSCQFQFVKPPMGLADSKVDEYAVEMTKFYKRLDKYKRSYDVALVSCGGIGNAVCNYLFEAHKKSAIYVGGVLPMYFGILGRRWEDERPDVVKMFAEGNPAWTRPATHERPSGFSTIEGGAYW